MNAHNQERFPVVIYGTGFHRTMGEGACFLANLGRRTPPQFDPVTFEAGDLESLQIQTLLRLPEFPRPLGLIAMYDDLPQFPWKTFDGTFGAKLVDITNDLRIPRAMYTKDPNAKKPYIIRDRDATGIEDMVWGDSTNYGYAMKMWLMRNVQKLSSGQEPGQ